MMHHYGFFGLLSQIVLFAGFIVFAFVRTRTLLAYFQQEEYNNRRFLDAILAVRLYDVRATLVALALFILGMFLLPMPLTYMLIGFALAGIAIHENMYVFKKPLSLTERAQRLQNLAFGLSVLLALSLFWHGIIVLVLLQIIPLCLIGANLVLAPVQERINQKYIDEAKAKLARIKPVTIGITGSFGKTTVKHILADLLVQDGNVFFSKGSINTVLGLTRHIRGRLQFSHKYFIAEMGAYGIGSIKRLCDFAQPTYGIITSIGDAHTERFGSIENIAIAKSELAEHVCKSGGKVVLPRSVVEHRPFAILAEKYRDQFIIVGETDADDVIVKNAVFENSVWTITFVLKDAGAKKTITLTLPLLGDHNIINLALVVAMVQQLAPDILDELQFLSPDIEQIAHRLELKEFPTGPRILDDAFNSNEQGFTNAVSVLRALADERGGKAVLVTPGVAELGVEHDAVHTRLGALAAMKCDHVIIVSPARLEAFASQIKAGTCTFDMADTLDDARKYVAKLKLSKDDVVLYENDLPDLLENKRLL